MLCSLTIGNFWISLNPFFTTLKIISLEYHIQQNQHNVSALEMSFTIFHCAVLAYVGVTILSVGSDLGSDVKVTGNFTASIKPRNVEVSHVLFDEPVKLDFGALTELCVLAVPVYSPLKILADLKFDEEPIVSVLEFKPRDTKYESVDQEIVGQKCRILVSVTWEHAFHKLPKNYLREWDDASDSESEDVEMGETLDLRTWRRHLIELVIIFNRSSKCCATENEKTKGGQSGICE